MKTKNKDLILLFIFMAFFNISAGFWIDFKFLWLDDNAISTSNIGFVIAVGSVITCFFGILFLTKFKKINIITLVKIFSFLAFSSMTALIFLNHKQLDWLIYTFIVINSIATNLIIFSTYPAVSKFKKDEKIFVKTKLIEYFCIDFGFLIAGLIVGKVLMTFVVTYNVLLIIACVLIFVAFIISLFIKTPKSEEQIVSDEKQAKIIKKIFGDKIFPVYFLYVFFGSISYAIALGMPLLLLTTKMSFSPALASTFLIVASLLADGVGLLVLYKLTPKNDYISIAIKFGFRLLGYLAIAVTNNITVAIVAIAVSLLVSRAYENKCDGVYFNRVNSTDMFAVTNLKYSVEFLGKSIGIALAGILFTFNLSAIFAVSSVFLAVQLLIGEYLVFMRHKEKKIQENTLVAK